MEYFLNMWVLDICNFNTIGVEFIIDIRYQVLPT